MRIHGRRRGFTIVELLTTLLILGILAGLIAAYVMRGRFKALHSACVQNIRTIAGAIEIYANDYQNEFPPQLDDLTVSVGGAQPPLPSLEACPSNEAAYGYQVDNTTHAYTIVCNGMHNAQLGYVRQGFPQYTAAGEMVDR